MNPVAIHLQLSPEAEALIKRQAALPREALLAMARAVDTENQHTVAHIQRDKMSFPKDGKPVPLGLRVQSNRLRASVRASKAVVAGHNVVSEIGSNVKYAAVHEFGATFNRTTKPGKVRLRVDRRGNLLRGVRGGAVFARLSHKSAVEREFAGGKTYKVTMPERAPFRRGIADRLSDYEKALSLAVINTLAP